MDYVCFVNDHHIQKRHFSKLCLEQCLLEFILYMKHDNVYMYDVFLWNWSKGVICDDTIFIAFCVDDAIGDEIP